MTYPPHTSKRCPIDLSSAPAAAEIDPAQVIGIMLPLYIIINIFSIGKYSPVVDGSVCTSVIGVGMFGVWQLITRDYIKCTDDLISDVICETFFQPEVHGYLLTELHNGMLTYDCLM